MDYISILNNQDIEKKIKLFKEPEFLISKEDCKNQYNVLGHDIFDKIKRPDKYIKKDTGQIDENGEPVTVTDIVNVSRIGLPMQKYIVDQRVGFMLSIPIDYNIFYPDNEKGKRMKKILEDILRRNKMDYKNKEVLRRQMSEMECARLWYFSPTGGNPKYTLKCKIVSYSLGDKLYPLKDEYDDLIAFAREYKIKEDGVEIRHFDIYTAGYDYKYVEKEGKWAYDNLTDSEGNEIEQPIPNYVKKIMAVYYQQQSPEWYDVQSMIDRLEKTISNHSDMDDYFGSPILAVAGEILGFAAKGEQGKILELSQDAKANYLALTTPPESIRMEIDNLRELIFSLSSTADISFDKVKGIGNLSAVALTLLFISSTMAAKSKEETFALGITREINLLVAAIGRVIDPSLESIISEVYCEPIITPYIPKDIEAMLKVFSEAYEKGIMSIESVVENNPLIVDKQKEIDSLKDAMNDQIIGPAITTQKNI